MEQLALYSDSESDDDQRSLQTISSPVAAADVSVASSAANSIAVAAAPLSTLSYSDVASGANALSTGSTSVTAVRYKCPGCAKTFANTGGVIKHNKSVSDPEGCSFEADHPVISGSITNAGTKVTCTLVQGLWVIQQPPKCHVSGSGFAWSEVMGYNHSTASVSKASDGDFLAKAEQLVLLPISAVFNKSNYQNWKAAVSAFFTTANDTIPTAMVSELVLLSSDEKLFGCVQSAPSNYSGDVALLMCYAADMEVEPSVDNVQKMLLSLLEDSKPKQKQASTLMQFAALLVQNQGLQDFKHPEKFQKCLTRCKHALKCAAFLKLKGSNNAAADTKWAKIYLDPSSANALTELQYWKRFARRCLHHDREERVRWKSDTEIAICTDPSSDTWVDVPLSRLAALPTKCQEEADDIIRRLGIQKFTAQELHELKDPQKVAIGTGMMEANMKFSSDFDSLQLPFDDDTVLKMCFDCGNKIGIAMSYSGAGTMRTPQLCAISVVNTNAGSSRSLRLIAGQTCIRYTAMKQDGLMATELAKILKNVLKFAYTELSATIATFVIKVKPLQIKAAMNRYGQDQARAAGSLLILNAQCLARTNKNDKLAMLKIVNDNIAKHIPGLTVNDVRHGIECVSKMAGRRYISQKSGEHDRVRAAMAHLSVHSEETSDAVYGGEEDTMFNLTHDDIDLFRCGSFTCVCE